MLIDETFIDDVEFLFFEEKRSMQEISYIMNVEDVSVIDSIVCQLISGDTVTGDDYE
jgi:hypothetical protein